MRVGLDLDLPGGGADRDPRSLADAEFLGPVEIDLGPRRPRDRCDRVWGRLRPRRCGVPVIKDGLVSKRHDGKYVAFYVLIQF